MKKIFGLLAVSAILFTSCKKDKTCDLNSASLAGSYQITSLKYKQTPTSAEIDVLASFNACERDDIFTFNSNSTFTYQDAGTLCVPSGSFTDTWSLSGNTLTYDGEAYNVSSFSCDNMVITQSNVNVSGDVITATFVRL